MDFFSPLPKTGRGSKQNISYVFYPLFFLCNSTSGEIEETTEQIRGTVSVPPLTKEKRRMMEKPLSLDNTDFTI